MVCQGIKAYPCRRPCMASGRLGGVMGDDEASLVMKHVGGVQQTVALEGGPA
jgi:hypothetical protein